MLVVKLWGAAASKTSDSTVDGDGSDRAPVGRNCTSTPPGGDSGV
jgi:hypothetical protein